MTEYLRLLEPILTAQHHERVKAIVKQFTAPTGLGPILQEYLIEKREAEANWAYNYWLNDMYMDVRLALPINSNPGMVLPPRKFTTVHDVARFSARFIDGIIKHKDILESGKFPQERATSREKGQPLCMAQYYRLLGACRRPGDPQDSQYLPEARMDQHVIVVCRNQMYCVPIRASDRGQLTEDEIASQLLYILSDAPCLPAAPPPVGLLTAQARDEWAHDREALLQDEQNVRNIELIEQSLILLCLDESLPMSFNARATNGDSSVGHFVSGRDETNMEHEMIHGGGSEYNSGNRWFDKTMQIIVCNDGTWGLCYEHSMAEGIAVIQLVEGILRDIDAMGNVEEGVGQQHLPPPERLEWVIRPPMQRRLVIAAKSFDQRIEDLDFYVYRYQFYGKNFIKACQVSPDCYIQLALQLAYYKLYGHLVSTYESAGTRRFLFGRVDCIRSATTEALEWAKAMCQDEGPNVPLESDKEDDDKDAKRVTFSIYSKDHLRELFRCAAARQTEIMVQNILGQGIDIHLLGLREACKERGGPLHELFTDESYKIANCFLLSTSQVACSTDSFMGYGPVTPKGYGCSYNPYPEEIVFCISAFFSAENTSTTRYAKSLQDSLGIMRDLLSS
ncbi:choline O-acetyltransferase [Lutzomyia longipalpis]|uniref:choline O-acetyltransferase n=1 Tax=Lutzomyia longipalpis TaxID=7200 RepID=UPI002484024F|nr:choline O-acetyltransferase [Lutzomyia longipalpis]